MHIINKYPYVCARTTVFGQSHAIANKYTEIEVFEKKTNRIEQVGHPI